MPGGKNLSESCHPRSFKLVKLSNESGIFLQAKSELCPQPTVEVFSQVTRTVKVDLDYPGLGIWIQPSRHYYPYRQHQVLDVQQPFAHERPQSSNGNQGSTKDSFMSGGRVFNPEISFCICIIQ